MSFCFVSIATINAYTYKFTNSTPYIIDIEVRLTGLNTPLTGRIGAKGKGDGITLEPEHWYQKGLCYSGLTLTPVGRADLKGNRNYWDPGSDVSKGAAIAVDAALVIGSLGIYGLVGAEETCRDLKFRIVTDNKGKIVTEIEHDTKG